MSLEDRPNAHFKAVDTYFTDEGLVLVCPDEAEAQRAFFEGQIKGQKLRLDGNKLILFCGLIDLTNLLSLG